MFPASALCLCCSLLVNSSGTSRSSQKKARKPSCKGGGKVLHALGSETPLSQSLLLSTRCQFSSLLLNANLHSYSARNNIFPVPVMQHGGSDTGGDSAGSVLVSAESLHAGRASVFASGSDTTPPLLHTHLSAGSWLWH